MEREQGPEFEKVTSSELIKSIYDEIGRDADRQDRSIELHEKLVAKAEELKKTYPDYYQRKVWHLIVGSSSPKEAVIEEDFPGEGSVRAFLEKLKKDFETPPM